MSYSHKDFTGRDLREAKDLNGQTIVGSCFSQEIPDSHIFPEDMTGVTFRNCNLMNVYIPPGNDVIECRTQRFALQNDRNWWEIDDNNIPTTVVDYRHFYKRGLKMPNPADIPDQMVEKRIELEKQ